MEQSLSGLYPSRPRLIFLSRLDANLRVEPPPFQSAAIHGGISSTLDLPQYGSARFRCKTTRLFQRLPNPGPVVRLTEASQHHLDHVAPETPLSPSRPLLRAAFIQMVKVETW